MVEKIAGDPISSAIWASEVFGSPDEWLRIREIVVECLDAGDSFIEDSPGVIKWVIESLEATFELKELSPFTQARFTVRIFEGFEDRADAIFFANALNQKATGGTFLHDAKSNSISFITYCGLNLWWDLALMLYSARAACGQAEAIAHRGDLLRYNKCQPAQSSSGVEVDGESSVVAGRLWDMYQPDFISGLWISDAERRAFMKELAEVDADFTVTPVFGEDSSGRNIEKMDFRYRAFPSEELMHVFNDSTASCCVLFNEWTEWGKCLSVHVGLPFFTHADKMPEGMSEETAVSLANIMNHASVETLFQKLGFGTWFAKETQLCFSTVIPHAFLKPVICGVDRFTVADFLFDLVDPLVMNRAMFGAAQLLRDMGEVSAREPIESDSIWSIIESRMRPEAVRASATQVELVEAEDFWTMPSTPFLVYGIFNPIGPTMGSLEIVAGLSGKYIVNRWRHPHHSGESILFEIDEEKGVSSNIYRAVLELAELVSLPDFISIPQDISPDIQDCIYDSLVLMARAFGDKGEDLVETATRMLNFPNPWERPSADESRGLEVAKDFEGMTSAEAYVAVSSNHGFVDLNIGLFQAWWEGAIAYLSEPNEPDPDRATETVQMFMKHTYDRMRIEDPPE